MSWVNRRIAIVGAVTLLATSCSTLVSPTATEPAGGVSTATEIAVPQGRSTFDASPVATFGAYQAAVNDMVTCMQSAGAAITEPVLNGATGQFEFDFDDANTATFDSCDDTFAVVETLYLDSGAVVPIGNTDPSDNGNLVGDWSTAPSDSWVRILASIPETTNTRWSPITIIDLERASLALGINRPGPGANDQAVLDYLGSLASGAGIVPAGPLAAFGRSAFPDQMRTELGFDHRTLDRVASAGVGARELVVAVGTFEEQTIADAVTNDPYWSDALTTTSYGTASLHSWGIDFDLDFDRFSPTRSVGHNRRLAVEGDRIGWARWTIGIESLLDAVSGNDRSLADVNDLAALAVVADEAGLVTGIISPSVSAFVVNLSDQRQANNLLQRPDALMIGDGMDDQGRFTLIALRYSSIAIAADELPVFEARMQSVAGLARADGLLRNLESPRLFEVQQAGPMLIAKIWLANDVISDPGDALLPTASDLVAFA